MYAYQFLAYDRAGLALEGTTDQSYCLWKGTKEQIAEAEFHVAYFEKFGVFPEEVDDYYTDAKYEMI